LSSKGIVPSRVYGELSGGEERYDLQFSSNFRSEQGMLFDNSGVEPGTTICK